ncbi:hypothetical protein SZ54_5020 [Rhizobium sp. UR51a]|nr:hypothetical protein SZ54_5020 [Rhizobium sp. UR51a]
MLILEKPRVHGFGDVATMGLKGRNSRLNEFYGFCGQLT